MLQNDEFTKDLFRFLQLLCEGHNGGEVVLFCVLFHERTEQPTIREWKGLERSVKIED